MTMFEQIQRIPIYGTSSETPFPPASAIHGDIQSMVELAESEREFPTGRDLMAHLIATDDWLPTVFGVPNPAGGHQFQIYRDGLERFSVVCTVLRAGAFVAISQPSVWEIAVSCAVPLLVSNSMGSPLPHAQVGEFLSLAAERGGGERSSVEQECLGALQHAERSDILSVVIHVYGGDIGQMSRHSVLVAEALTRGPWATPMRKKRSALRYLFDLERNPGLRRRKSIDVETSCDATPYGGSGNPEQVSVSTRSSRISVRALSEISVEPQISSSWATLVTLTIGAVTPGWAGNQARAICAGVALPRSAAASSSRKMSRLRSSSTRATTAPRAAPAVSATERYFPVSNPASKPRKGMTAPSLPAGRAVADRPRKKPRLARL